MDAASGSAEDLEKNAKGAGKGMEDGGKGAKTFDVALARWPANALSSGDQQVRELDGAKTKELRRDLSFLEQNARDAGMGMEQLHNKAGELYAVTGDTNEVVEALSNILATGFDDADKAYEAVDLLAGAVVKFPETMKIESLADSLQETIATGEATGQFSELLGRLGVDVEKFNERLGRTRSEASRPEPCPADAAQGRAGRTMGELQGRELRYDRGREGKLQSAAPVCGAGEKHRANRDEN